MSHDPPPPRGGPSGLPPGRSPRPRPGDRRPAAPPPPAPEEITQVSPPGWDEPSVRRPPTPPGGQPRALDPRGPAPRPDAPSLSGRLNGDSRHGRLEDDWRGQHAEGDRHSGLDDWRGPYSEGDRYGRLDDGRRGQYSEGDRHGRLDDGPRGQHAEDGGHGRSDDAWPGRYADEGRHGRLDGDERDRSGGEERGFRGEAVPPAGRAPRPGPTPAADATRYTNAFSGSLPPPPGPHRLGATPPGPGPTGPGPTGTTPPGPNPLGPNPPGPNPLGPNPVGTGPRGATPPGANPSDPHSSSDPAPAAPGAPPPGAPAPGALPPGGPRPAPAGRAAPPRRPRPVDPPTEVIARVEDDYDDEYDDDAYDDYEDEYYDDEDEPGPDHHEEPPTPPQDSTARKSVRAVGELLITAGLVILLFVVYEVYVTDLISAGKQDDATHALDDKWNANTVEPADEQRQAKYDLIAGQAFAKMYIPVFGPDYKFSVVEGTTDKDLEIGPGHYVNTALPGNPGNFAVAGHRVGKGAPFNDLDLLASCDAIVVETQTDWFVYRMLPKSSEVAGWAQAEKSTSPRCAKVAPLGGSYDKTVGQEIVLPSQGEVINAVPHFTGTAPEAQQTALMTLTTCHPRFSDKQRLIVHAVLTQHYAKAPGFLPEELKEQ
ncbi:class E sortase [Actinosynnema sp. NPDC050436]|uniref:class E sortase n=1 Tax=Actinosynnema sp. NPDC050436 TaxID=3155659 RepID=UPI0033E4262D